MQHLHPIVLCALLATLCNAPVSAAENTAPVAPAPATFIVVRHAEKSAVSGDVPLSAEGQARAMLLAAMLEPAGVSAIYSSELTFNKETAQPVAEQLKLAPISIPVRDTAKLIDELKKRPPGSVTLLVGHSGSIPEVIEKLGGARPTSIDPQTYDRMFIVTRWHQTRAAVVELRYGVP